MIPEDYHDVYLWSVIVTVFGLCALNVACEGIKWDIRNLKPIEIGTPEYNEIYGYKPNPIREWLEENRQR